MIGASCGQHQSFLVWAQKARLPACGEYQTYYSKRDSYLICCVVLTVRVSIWIRDSHQELFTSIEVALGKGNADRKFNAAVKLNTVLVQPSGGGTSFLMQDIVCGWQACYKSGESKYGSSGEVHLAVVCGSVQPVWRGHLGRGRPSYTEARSPRQGRPKKVLRPASHTNL